MSTFDADALATLTDEERAAIQSDDEDAGAAPAAEADAPGADAEGDDGDDDNDEDGDAQGEDSAAASDPAPAPAAAAPAAAPTTATPTGYQAALPADYDDKVKAVADREAELKRAFRAGELEFDEFETRRDELQREREGLTIARAKAEIASEMQAQTAETQWRTTVERFLDTSAAALDYRKDSEAMADLDGFVKVLAGRESNSRQPMEWFLAEAHKRVMALRGPSAAPAPAPAPAVDRKAEAAAARKPRLDDVPATLAQVPGGDGPGDIGGEFADVLALDGLEYEAAIARMTPVQRERFARAI
jgi:hypothetical protein